MDSNPAFQTQSVDYYRHQSAQALSQVFNQQPDFSPHIHHVLEQLGSLGEGGMGRVFRVRDKRLGREAALKILQPNQGDMDAILRFKREAQIMARLDHPGIPPVYESGMTPDGQPFLLMKLVKGATLTERIAQYHEDGCPEDERDELLRALIRVSEAVAYGHSRGVIHRDLKPDNIMIGQYGEVQVMDWGLAKLIKERDDPRLTRPSLVLSKVEAQELGATQEGQLLGTPGYMAPEQVNGEGVCEASDVFSLGVILNVLLTHKMVIPGGKVIEVLMNTVKGDFQQWSADLGDYPPGLRALAEAALRPEFELRMRSAEDFASGLRDFVERRGESGAGAPSSLAWVLVLLLLSVGAGFGWQWRHREGTFEASRQSQDQAIADLEQSLQRGARDQQKMATQLKSMSAVEAARELLAERLSVLEEADKDKALALIETHYHRWRRQSGQQRRAGWWAYQRLKVWDKAEALRHLEALHKRDPSDTRLLFELLWLDAVRTPGRDRPREESYAKRLLRVGQAQSEPDVYVEVCRGMEDSQSSPKARLQLVEQAMSRAELRHPLSFLFRAQLKLVNQDYESALRDYDEALRLAPGTALVLIKRGQCRHIKGRAESALGDFYKALEGTGNGAYHIQILEAIGDLHYSEGEWQRSWRAYDRAIIMAKERGLERSYKNKLDRFRARISYCYQRAGCEDLAEQVWNSSKTLKRSIWAEVRRLREQFERKFEPSMVSALAAMIKRAPRNGDAYVLLAEFYLRQNRAAEALRVLGRIKNSQLTYYTGVESSLVKAEALRGLKRIHELQSLVKNLSLRGRFGKIMGGLYAARDQLSKGNSVRSEELTRKLLVLAPHNKEILAVWVQSQFKLRAYASIVERLERERERGAVARLQLWLGDAYRLQGRSVEACRYYEQAVLEPGHTPETALSLAECRIQLKQYQQALKQLNRVVAAKPGMKRAEELRNFVTLALESKRRVKVDEQRLKERKAAKELKKP